MKLLASHTTVRPELVEGFGGISFGCLPPARSMAARGQSLLAFAPKVTKKACPASRCFLRCSQRAGCVGRHPRASLTLRTVCADDASTTARCSAPRRGPKGRLGRHQLFGESVVAFGHRALNCYLSTLDVFCDLAHIEWTFQEKANRSPDARHLGSRGMDSTEIKFDFAKLRNPDASIWATCKLT